MQNLMELETGWSNLDTAFIYKVVQILANPNNLINVCRPATAILKKLVEADPRRMPDLISGSGSRVVSTCSPTRERVSVRFRRRLGADEKGAGAA
jgi:engulfment/cell motility protein 1